MMQNVAQEENEEINKEIRTVEIEQSTQTGPFPSEKSPVPPTSQSTFGPDISASEDDEVSDVGSFIMDHDIDEDEQDLEPSKFLLPTEGMEASNLPSIDPETHARLEALLEAAGIGKLSTADGKALTDPEVLRKLTSSVSCALDEAAQALHRMRAEQQGQLTTPEGSRSLAEACSDGDVPTVRKLLHEGGSVHETTEEGESLLSLACSAGYYELAQVLLAMKANVEDRGIKGDCTPLMEAASGGYVDIVKLLIAHGADVNAQSSAGNTPLHYAACGGYEDVVQVLIEAGANVEQHNENGHTPLMESASAGHVGVAMILLNSGAGINTHSNEFKESALTLACYKGHLEMVKFLLEAGADQEHKTDEMHTALMEASMDGHVEVARLLLDSGAQVNMPADSFESPLTLAACGGHVELASLLIERGANLEEVNDEGYTPLMEAAREGHEEMVALLLAHEADINAQTEETQETSLTLACCGGFLEVADFLIKAGADIELGCSTPLMEAAQEGHLELVKYLLKSGAKVCAQTGTGDTALTYACENGHTDVAEVLLEAGAELEHESEGGRTPLMKAARAGHLCTVQFLISKGAEVNRQTSTNDHTVLSLACAGGHLAVVELMLAHGADPAHKMKDGSTMIIEAAKGGHTQVVKLLLEYPNRVIMNSPDLTQLTDQHLSEARVPVHGLGNIVPPSDPDSTPLSSNGFINIQAGKKILEKDVTIPNRPADQVWKNMQKSVGKRNHSGGGGGNDVSGSKSAKSSESAVPGEPSSQPSPPLLPVSEHSTSLPDLVPDETIDVKASERLEAIINNVMAKELDNTSTREEQILRKQQILQELQKVEKELQLKAQAQLILSAQHQLEQQQQQQHIHALQRKLKKQDGAQPPGSTPSLEDLSLDSPVDTQPPSNDLDKKVSAFLTDVGSTAVGQIVFPNIPYEGAIVTSSQQAGTDVVTSENSKENWARNNGNVPKRSSGNNKVTRSNKNTVAPTSTSTSTTTVAPQNKNTVTSTTNTTTSTSEAPITGIVNGTTNVEHNGGSQSQQQQQHQAGMGNNAALVAYRQQIQNMAIRQQLSPQPLQLSQQNASAQTIQFPPLQLTPEQQEQLLQMLSQQTFQQQLPQQTLPGQQLPQQHITQQPFVQPLLQQQTLQLIPPQQQQQSIQQCAPGQPQYFTQQQQQQLVQQQQQAQLLLQQQMKQPQQNIVTPNVGNVQKNPRKQRHLHNNQQPLQPGVIPGNSGMLGIETITPPPSTPLTPNPSPASPQSISPLCAPIDLDAQTESNHDTALTLACHGGHSELVSLLLSKGADIEHRDKKGFTPLILAATAGHVEVVELLLDHGADMEAQSERTKDTPLSLACSGGRYEVVELLLSRGANKEHRNVSDYTPLSLAASGGYVNIIKLLLSHGAEINSRTGSKLGISPLMLAAMNGHTAAVKLLLDMGSDINAQIETNRNTALTLACFQGRHEVVSLLVDRKANIEHRAKTGLTPLMEAASGGYVEVGRVLLDKGADVNAPPVPSSRDTALTIAADKGHYRFVELLLTRGAAVDVKNKKGNSPLWLACNGGHLDVVQLLVSAGADIDSQDNRKVSCLMAAFRKGHIKVVKWMVKNVNQFPSDQELSRYIATITDKELQKKCQQCMEVIVSAKDRQAAEANKNANILLEELDKERQHEENKKAAAAKKREKKKQKKREKQEKEKETTGKSSSPEPECDSIEGNQGSDKNSLVEEDFVNTEPPSATVTSTIGITLPTTTESRHGKMSWSKNNNRVDTIVVSSTESKKNKRNKREKERVPDQENMPVPAHSPSPVLSTGTTTTSRNSETVTRLSEHSNNNNNYNKQSNHNSANTRRRKGNNPLKPTTGIGDLDDFGTLPENLKISDKEVEKLRKNVEKKRANVDHEGKISNEKLDVVTTSNLNVKTSPVISSPKKGQKKEEGWKEVIRKSKKVQVPSNAISRVIGRGGCNINSIREVSGAHIEVEKQRGTGGERVITIKGSLDATRQANALITALVTDPDKDLLEILPKTKAKVSNKDTMIILGPETAIPPIGSPVTSGTTPLKSSNTNRSSRNTSSQRDQNLANTGTVQSTVIWGTTPPPQSVITSPRRNLSKVTPSSGPQGSEKVVTRQLFPGDKKSGFTIPPQTSTNTTMSYSLASTSAKVSTTSASAYVNKQDNRISNVTSKSQQQQQQPPQTRPIQQPHIQPPVGSIKVLQRPSPSQKFDQPQPLPIISGQQTSTINGPVTSVNGGQPGMGPGMPNQGMFQPFSNMFNINVTDQLMRKDDQAERMNFASVAAAGVVPSMGNPGSPTAELALSMQNLKVDPALQAKAPGFRPPNAKNMSPPGVESEGPGYKVLQAQMMNDIDVSRAPGYRGGLPNHSPAVSPRSNASTASGMSPRGQNSGLDSSQHSTSSVSSQKEEYTTPTQPMTLPKIQSTLNPNAPDFTSRQMGQVNLGGGNPGLTPNTLPFYLQTLYQQALAQQLLQQPGLGMSGGSGMVPPGAISQQDFANLINQFVASGQNQPGSGPNVGGSANQNAPAFNGLPNIPPRPFSPLQGRPSSAPNMGGMVKEGSSPGPIGHPNAPSPMSATPPLPEQQLKGDDTKKLRPIGGERAQRRAPGAPIGSVGGGNLADYGPAIWSLASELSMQWNTGSTGSLNSVPMSTSTMTSTVTTGGRMSPCIVSDGPVNAVHHNNNEYIDTDEQPINKNMQNASVQMPFFAKGMVGGGFPQQPQPQQQQPFIPGPVGDGMSNLWNPQAKGQVTDPSDKAMWNSWSSQTSM